MVQWLIFLLYVVVCVMALWLDRKSKLEERVLAQRHGDQPLPRALTLPRSDAGPESPTGAIHLPPETWFDTLSAADRHFLIALGWSCAKARRSGKEAQDVLLFLFYYARQHPARLPRAIRRDITAALALLLSGAGETQAVAIPVYEAALASEANLQVFASLFQAYYRARRWQEIVRCWHKRRELAGRVLEIARLKQRHFVAILFSSKEEVISFRFLHEEVAVKSPAKQHTISFLEGLIDMASFSFGGGTDYEAPLREAMGCIGTDPEQCADADIVFITDDYCEVSDGFLEEYSTLKGKKGFSTYSVIIGADAAAARTLRKFSDQVVSSLEITEELAGKIFEAV